MSNKIITARSEGLMCCRRCHQLIQINEQPGKQYCPRCGKSAYFRQPHAVTNTWALLFTAAMLMFPANLYPVMSVTYVGDTTSDTIISGVIRLAETGMMPIAILVFVASVFVPLIKLIGLSFLLLVIQCQWKISRAQATALYRMIVFIGRWSMLDLFMVSILVTLVDLGFVAKVDAGLGATAFALVVITTMFAAHSFDCRLLWDRVEEDE